MATWRKPSPVRSSVACSPEPRPILPSGASITPELATLPPISPTKPPLPVLMAPELKTCAEAPGPLKFRTPELKSPLERPSVEAMNPPPTLTAPEGVIAMPLGLTRKTSPLALICPASVEGADPSTRFRIADDALG